MKTAIKVLNIISFVGCLIGAIFFFISGIIMIASGSGYSYDYDTGYLIGAGVGYIIGGIIITIPGSLGLLVNKKVEEAYSKDSLIIWGVLSLLFINTISGILILCLPESEFYNARRKPQTSAYRQSYTASSVRPTASPTTSTSAGETEVMKKLSEIKKLYDQQLITKEEFEEMKREILSKM